MKTLNLLLAGAAFAVSGGMASASTIYADIVVSSSQGTCTGAGAAGNANGCFPDRSDPNSALDAPDGNFFSLGDGGHIVVGFSSAPFGSGTASVWEITTNRKNEHKEAIEVYSIFKGVQSALLGVITNFNEQGSVFVTGAFDSIKLVDITYSYFLPEETTSFDGFDVDAVSVSNVSPIPLPAAGFLLLAGLGGLAAVRRKKS
jgi:hypothetical protein